MTLRISHTIQPEQRPSFNEWANTIHRATTPPGVSPYRVYCYDSEGVFIRFIPCQTIKEQREKLREMRSTFPDAIFSPSPIQTSNFI